TLEDRWLPSTINTWVAPGSSGNWNTAANWSLGHVPTSTEVATFDASSAAVCTIDAPAMGTNTVSGINITSGYAGPIQDSGGIVTGPDGFVQAGGSFAVTGSGNLDLGGANRTFTVGGTLSISAQLSNGGLSKLGSGSLTLSGANTYGGG